MERVEGAPEEPGGHRRFPKSRYASRGLMPRSGL
jgi:hypothetical protein